MRRFEFVGGSSAKFWQCKVDGSTFTIVFGRLGTDGQRKEKEFDDEEAAEAEMQKKITEKLKEGYTEVASAASSAEKGAAAAAPKLAMPARLEVDEGKTPPALIKAVTTSMNALARSAKGRSWRRQLAVKQVQRALQRINAADYKEVEGAFDSVVDAVVAKPALPLRCALAVCDELPSAAFARALSRWSTPAGPAAGAITALRSVREGLGDDELALRVGAALVDRGTSDAGAAKRFQKVRSFAEAAAAKQGGLKKWLSSVDDGGDSVVARRKKLFV